MAIWPSLGASGPGRERTGGRPTPKCRAGCCQRLAEEAVLKSIVCAVDFSDQSRHALRWAVALAVRYQARLIVFTAVDPLLAEAARVRAHLDLARTEVDPALREFVRGVLPEAASWAPQPVIDVREGNAAEAILETTTRHAADLVVMGTQGLGGFRKLILG